MKSGEIPDGMFIITSGQCKAVMEGIGINKLGSGEYSRFQTKPKNFACGTVPDKIFAAQIIKADDNSPDKAKKDKEAIPQKKH